MLTPRTWTGGGPTVMWAHPSGRSSVFGADGATPVPTVQWLLERGAMVIVSRRVPVRPRSAADAQGGRLPRVKDDERFATYNYGYNRALLAERVRDLLTTVAFAKAQQPGPVHLVAFDRAGVWALLSRALAGNSIARASIDLDGFDFAGIEDPFDPMMLPGAVKYGGIGGFLPLITAGQTEVYRAPPAALESEAGRRRPSGLVVRDGSPEPDRMVRWVMGDR